MIKVYEFLGLIDESNQQQYIQQFGESGFEIYSIQALVEVEEDKARKTSHDLEAKLNTSKALDQIRSCFFELSDFVNQLDLDKKDRLYKYQEEEIAQYSQRLISQSLDEWIRSQKHVILF